MARNSTARGEIVRRFGVNIFGNQKYDRLLKRRPNPPENPKRGRIRQTELGRQLIEEQKLKWAYGRSEKQFSNLFCKAKSMKGVPGDNLLILLEKRLDNVVYRLGMATSSNQASQLVSHGHILLNGRKLTIPSAVLRPQDSIAVRDRKPKTLFARFLRDNSSRPIPPWRTISRDEMIGTVDVSPTRDVIPTIAEEQLIGEFYSK